MELKIGNQLTIDQQKSRELEILMFFHKFCEEHNLKYYLYSGTLIGAIRHKGFIPWDDDVDVAMLREDYMKLIEIYKNGGDFGKYKFSCPFTEDDCPIAFGKIYDTETVKCNAEVKKKYWRYGVDIDIFPWDYCPEDKENREIFYKKEYRLYRLFGGLVGKYTKKENLLQDVAKWIYISIFKILGAFHFLNAQKIALKMNEIAMKQPKSNVLCSCMLPNLGSCKSWARIDDFQDRELVKFENSQFYIPSGYHNILTNIYGDYMKLPPVEKQKTHHLSDTYLRIR